MHSRPRIALLLGDRNGIGPEVAAELLADREAHAEARVIVLGDPGVLLQGAQVARVALAAHSIASPAEAGETPLAVLPLGLDEAVETTPGRATAAAGREMLAALDKAAALGKSGAVDGLVFAPLNKQAIHLSDPGFRDELAYLARALGHEGPRGEINVLEGLWTARVTSHVALAEVATLVTEERVAEAIRLVHGALAGSGLEGPRIAVAALNPHAGEGGLFGREELDEIAPAVARAQGEGIAAEGPFPADTVFVTARERGFDAVVAMYHDQGQIAMKLLGSGRGVTVLGGLPLPVTTPGHGTAYDIAGRGVARADAMRAAFRLCCLMAARRQSMSEEGADDGS